MKKPFIKIRCGFVLLMIDILIESSSQLIAKLFEQLEKQERRFREQQWELEEERQKQVCVFGRART